MLAIEDVFKHRVTNVVFMGMGEPMLNLKSVLDAHRCLNKVAFAIFPFYMFLANDMKCHSCLLVCFSFTQDIEIGQRMITISTVGVPNTIKKLAAHKLQSTLAVRLLLLSLTARSFILFTHFSSVQSAYMLQTRVSGRRLYQVPRLILWKQL